jgi:hypothetical protein
MQKLIDGLLYDTDESKELASWSNERTDFTRCWEELHLTEGGSLFLYGSGGPRSKYATHHHGGSSGGSDIIPMTREEAYDWCERRGCIEAALKYFPEYIDRA